MKRLIFHSQTTSVKNTCQVKIGLYHKEMTAALAASGSIKLEVSNHTRRTDPWIAATMIA